MASMRKDGRLRRLLDWLSRRIRAAAGASGRQRGTGPADPLRHLSGQALAEAVTDPLMIFDRAGRLVHANAAAHAAFDGLRNGMSLPLRFRTPEMQATLDALTSGAEASAAIEYSERLPVERAYRVSATMIGQGSEFGVLVFKDQSEARRIDRMRSDFIANASHELRTPLSSIAGFIETLRGPARDDTASRDRFLAIMQDQTDRMARLIDDLLSLSRLETKPYLRPGTRFDLKATLDAVIASMAPLAQENGVTIECHLGHGQLVLPGDEDEMFQVFQNLIENACKYGRTGGRVVISSAEGTQTPGPTVDVTVRDFGAGIAEQDIPRLTERFYRVEAETSRAQKGTGLGLAIVKHILTRHRAWLSISSEPGKGAAFTVHLPAK